MDKKKFILEKLNNAGIRTDEKTAQMLLLYSEMLSEKNKVMNLTAITEFEEVVEKHFVDSLAPLISNVSRETFGGDETGDVSRETFLRDGVKIIDVGTGAGFPGLPLKIALPNAEVHLVDALNKRVEFLSDVVKSLDLEKTTTLHARAEDAARLDDYREKFDICVSRAVSDLAILVEYCLPFVRKGGIFVAYKSVDSDEEVRGASVAIETLGGKIKQIETVTLPDSSIKRKLIIIEKVNDTPEKYPRKAGKPEKKPIR